MFYYVKGPVVHTAPNLAVVDCGGVGYACNTTAYTLGSIKRSEVATLYTYLHVREDIFELYGFATENELRCFRMLIGVSGVGPKAALSILSSTSPEGLAMSIITGDERALMAGRGVGKKIAQRVILELKDKLAKGQLDSAAEGYSGTGVTIIPENKLSEAAAALAVLGYAQSEIAAALRGIDMESAPLEDIVRQALKKMMK